LNIKRLPFALVLKTNFKNFQAVDCKKQQVDKGNDKFKQHSRKNPKKDPKAALSALLTVWIFA
jgi:hypothetical protein